MEKVFGQGGNKGPQFFDVVFNKTIGEQQRADPSLPQRYESRSSKTEAPAERQDALRIRSPHVPRFRHRACVESGLQLAYTDTYTTPHVFIPVQLPPLHYCGPLSAVLPDYVFRRERSWARHRCRGGTRSS